MVRKLLKITSAAALAVLALAVSGCKVDELYTADNIANVDKTVTLFENGLSIPLVQNTAKLRIDSILKSTGVDTTQFGDYLIVDADGNYCLSISGTYELDSLIASLGLSDMVKIDAVDFSQDFSYDMGDLDASSMKIDAQNFGSDMTLDDFSSSLDINIDPISETVSQKAGLTDASKYSMDYNIDPIQRNQELVSKSTITSAASAASLLGQSSITLPNQTVPVNMDPQTVPAVSLPENVKSVSSVTLKSGAKMVVSLEVSNCILSEGTITPDIDVDLSQILLIQGVSGALDLSGLELNKANNYKNSQEYVLSGVNVEKLFTTKTVTMSGNMILSGATATTAAASATAGALGLNVSISFVNFGVESLVCEIEPVSTQVSQDIPLNLPEITLPEQVKSVGGITFTDASAANITISAKNLSKISGMDAKIKTLTVEFPSALQVSGTGVANNKLTIADASLASGITRVVRIEGVTLPAAVNGKINYSGNIKVNAEMEAGGTINTALLPKTDADDVTLEAAVVANLALADFSAVINPISQEVKVDEEEIKMELPDGVGDFGTFTIVPKGSPALKVSMNIPDLGGLNITTGNGIKVVLPDIVKFASVPAELNYNAENSTITITDIKTAEYVLPIEKIVVTPKKDGNSYSVTTKYSVNGTVGIAESTVTKAVVDKVSGATIAFQASIPEIQAESISVDELAYDIDEKFKFNIMEAESIPDMLVCVEEIKLTDVDAVLNLDLSGLPDIGNGKFIVDITANMPSFIDPSVIELKGEIGQDGKFNKTVRINGFDLSSVDFQKLKADGKSLADSIMVTGKVKADHPSLNLNNLSGKLTGSVAAKIADANNKIGVKSMKAKVDYQIDTVMKVGFFTLPDVLKDCNFDLPDVTLTADVRSNLAIPVSASANIQNGLYALDLNFPYSADPKDTVTVNNSFTLDFDPLLNDTPDSLEIKVNIALDKTRSCYFVTDATYTLDLEYGVSCPIALGEHFEIAYADTIALGESGKSLEEILGYSGAGITAKADNGLPFSATIVAEFLAYDEQTDSYRKLDFEPIESELLKAKSQSDIELLINAKKGADISGISHIRFSAKLTANGDALHPEDYIQLSNLALVVPDGVTLDFDSLTNSK